MMKVGFIGCGNMGGALLSAALKTLPAADILAADRDDERLRALEERYALQTGTAQQIAACADYVFLGVKPQGLPGLFEEIAPALAARKDRFVLISMAAGVSIRQIEDLCGCPCAVIRIMPNTPVAVGAGMILYAANALVSSEEVADFTHILAAAGRLDALPEALIDAACALSGSGPAFVDVFIEALSDGAVACGLPRDKALLYAAQMVYGAAKLMLESAKHPAQLKDAVCSPGGTTIAGVQALEEGAFRADTMAAVTAAYDRALELGR